MKGFPLLIVYQVHATGALNMSMASPMLFSNAAFLLLACNHFTSVRGHPTKVSVSDKGSQLTFGGNVAALGSAEIWTFMEGWGETAKQ